MKDIRGPLKKFKDALNNLALATDELLTAIEDSEYDKSVPELNEDSSNKVKMSEFDKLKSEMQIGDVLSLKLGDEKVNAYVADITAEHICFVADFGPSKISNTKAGNNAVSSYGVEAIHAFLDRYQKKLLDIFGKSLESKIMNFFSGLDTSDNNIRPSYSREVIYMTLLSEKQLFGKVKFTSSNLDNEHKLPLFKMERYQDIFPYDFWLRSSSATMENIYAKHDGSIGSDPPYMEHHVVALFAVKNNK